MNDLLHSGAATSVGTPSPALPQFQKRSSPGILVLNTSLAVVFRSDEARSLCDQLSRWEFNRPANGILPKSVVALGEQLISAFKADQDAKAWEQSRLSQIAGDPQEPILLRGFGLPPGRGLPMSHVLIVMERYGLRKHSTPDTVREKYSITERESEILDCLAKGATNKEIALTLDISEQTVKEHLKNLLRKTKTTTRTGLISQILLSEQLPHDRPRTDDQRSKSGLRMNGHAPSP